MNKPRSGDRKVPAQHGKEGALEAALHPLSPHRLPSQSSIYPGIPTGSSVGNGTLCSPDLSLRGTCRLIWAISLCVMAMIFKNKGQIWFISVSWVLA